MVRTRVGYAGGSKAEPTYRALGDHTETIQIDYDPAELTYERLLEIFWDAHDPFARSWSRQYASVLFFHDDAQRRAALASKERLEATSGRKVLTAIVAADRFWRAEDYHQKHRLRNDSVLGAEIETLYSDGRALTDSTAAARINGFLGGFGSLELLQAEIDAYGLSAKGRQRLLKIFEP